MIRMLKVSRFLRQPSYWCGLCDFHHGVPWPGPEVQNVMVQPIKFIFRYMQNRSRIQVWLYEQVNMRIEGCIIVSTQAIFPQVVIKKDISEDGQ